MKSVSKKMHRLNISVTALHLLRTLEKAVGGKSKRKKRKGNVGEWLEPTFCQRRRLLELNPGKLGKPRLSSASRANNKKEPRCFETILVASGLPDGGMMKRAETVG